MKRLIVICEGQAEREFCQDVLRPFFASKGAELSAPTIKHSNGGIVAWDTLKKQIVAHLHEQDAVVTMLIDFYRIKDSFNYPGWMEAKQITDPHRKMNHIFSKIADDMGEEYQRRFVPYIQLHEFECLLFSDIKGLQYWFAKDECDYTKIQKAISSFANSEEINNGANTAPSVRLLDAIHGYDKALYASVVAGIIGLATIRAKCPLFNEWLNRIEALI